MIRILTAWYFWITNRNNKLAKSRLMICAACEKRKWGLCSVCGCPLIAKARLTGEYDEGCADTPQRWLPVK